MATTASIQASTDSIVMLKRASARIINFSSLKGGVGKSTAAGQIAAALAQLGRRVLLVDADSTCSASHLCGYENTGELADTIAAVLMGEQSLEEVVQPILPQFDLLRGTTSLRKLESLTGIKNPAIAMPDGRLSDLALRLALEPATSRYDYILIDCAGGHPKIMRMALLAADEVIMPTGMSLVDLNAAATTLELIAQAQELRQESGRPSFLGFLPNATGKAGVPAKLKELLDGLGYPCFSPIRASAVLRTISGAAKVERRFITRARPNHPTAQSFLKVAREIVCGIDAVAAGDASDTIDTGLGLPPEVSARDRVPPRVQSEEPIVRLLNAQAEVAPAREVPAVAGAIAVRAGPDGRRPQSEAEFTKDSPAAEVS